MREIPTVKRVLVQIAIIISLVELFTMLALAVIPHHLSPLVEAVIDALSLVIISTPFIYAWVIKPFIVARDEANHLAQRDHLTLVSNRLYLMEHLERCFSACARRGTYAALLYIDLDGFKRVNDVHGHAAGDALLIEAANRMRSIARREDVIFRLGGDEFVVLVCPLEGSGETVVETSRNVADKLRTLLREPFIFRGQELQVDSSIGIRVMDGGNTDPEVIVRQADVAMYQAKLSGGGRIVVFNE
jgi:two-component system cell cycle response regulator